jgi:hypothetical protein
LKNDSSPNGAGKSLATWAAEVAAAVEIARQMTPTSFVPDSLRVWSDDEKTVLDFDATVQTVAMVLLAGQELGFGPMASLRSITIIKGTVGLYALAARALLLQHGHEIEIRESTSQRAIVDGRREGSGQWQRSTWDIARATTAKLFPGRIDGNWRTQTKSMLVARATAEASRWVAADALLGLPLMVEEIEDGATEVPAIGSAATSPGPEPGAEAPAAEEAPKRTARRKRTPAAGNGLPDRPPPDPVPPMASPDPGPEIPPEPVEPRLTRSQRKRIIEGLQGIGKADTAEAALEFVATAAERAVESTGDLTVAEADKVLAAIAAVAKLTASAEPEAPADPVEGEPADQPEGTEPLPGMDDAPPPEDPGPTP